MNENKSTLKPCPFCGAEASLEQIRDDNHNYWADGLYYIVADHDWRSCPLYAVAFGHYGGGYNEETGEYSPITDKAVKACEDWNRRAYDEHCRYAAEAFYNEGYRKQRGLISVEERVPDKNGVYIVALTESEYENLLYFDVRQYAYGEWCNIPKKLTVTHWMPLPEPPKGDRHEM